MSRERIAVVYDRASSPAQKANFARDDAARLYRFAEERGLQWDLRQEIKSGEDLANRPVMRGILDEIADGRVAALIVQDFTRLSRDEDGIDGRIIRQFCRDHGCVIVTPEKVYDFDSDADDDLADVQFLVGKWQKRANLRAMTRGMVERARQGLFLPSTTPFGYDVVFEPDSNDPARLSRRWIQNPAEATIVRLIHGLYEMMSIRQIALHLNEHEGLRPIKNRSRQRRDYAHVDHVYRVKELPEARTHRAWTRVDVREVLSPNGNAELYAGFVTWGTERRSRHTRGIEPIVDFRPGLQIISVEQLNRTKRLLAERGKAAPRTVTSAYVFSGLLRCVHCGGAMSGHQVRQSRSGMQVRKYVCRRYHDAGKIGCAGQSLQEATVRRIVAGLVSQILEKRLALNEYLDDAARLLEGGPTENELRQRLEAELHDVEQAIVRLVEAIADGVIRASQAKEKNLDLLERKERIENRLLAASERGAIRAEMNDAMALVGRNTGDLIDGLDNASFKRLARLIFIRLSISGKQRGSHFDGEVTAYEFAPAFADLLSHSHTPVPRRSGGRGGGRGPSSRWSGGGSRPRPPAAPALRTGARRRRSPAPARGSRCRGGLPRSPGHRPCAARRRSAPRARRG